MKKILIPIDGSETAKRAVDAAVSLCKGRENSCRVTLVHVSIAAANYAEAGVALNVDIDEVARERGLQLLKDTAGQIPDNGLEVEIIQLVGFAAEAIVDLAEKERYDLIVMGSRALGTLGEVVLGSVSHKVLHETRCPVMIVK